METRTTVDTQAARAMALRLNNNEVVDLGGVGHDWINDLAADLDATRAELEASNERRRAHLFEKENAQVELAAIRAHCYGPGNESAMDQMIARAKAAEAEVEGLRNELARYQGMTMHAEHPAVIAAERDRLRARLDMLIAQCFDPLDDDDPDHYKVPATAIRAAMTTADEPPTA